NDPIDAYVHDVLKEVAVVPDTKPSGPQHTTKPSALGAMEIGASSSAIPESVIETRYVVNDNTNEEAEIEMFLGRSALWSKLNLTGKFAKWNINFQEQANIRKKFELFTYLRFDMEVTIVTNNKGLMQVMFIPPGLKIPENDTDRLWDSASNPSVFFQPKNGFPRFTIPFTGLASAYYIFYDGYTTRDIPERNKYGISPTNDMGTLCFRALDDSVDSHIKVYIKPKHITAWVPRPPRATEYTHAYSTNYHYKEKDASEDTLKSRHFMEFRTAIKNVGP
ncbi:polyprotein, partial [Rhinovirus C]